MLYLRKKGGLNYSFSHLCNLTATALNEESWDALIAKLRVYKNLTLGNWHVNNKKIKKLGINTESLELDQQIIFPKLGEPFGEVFLIKNLDKTENCYFLYKPQDFLDITQKHRYWGRTIHELILWKIAEQIITLGVDCWNSLMISMNAHNRANRLADDWEDNAFRAKSLNKYK